MTIRPTQRATQGTLYRRERGPWQVSSLHTLLSLRKGFTVVDGARQLGAPEVTDAAARLASGLRAAGVGRGDAVAWQLPNGLASVLLYRACWQLGAIGVPIHQRAAEPERELRLASVGATACITDPMQLDQWLRLDPYHGHHAHPSDPAVVLFTAGSTGDPKGVIHTHRTLASKAVQMVELHGLSARDAVLMPAPLAHVSGLLNGVLVPGLAGMRSVLQARWDPDDALALIADHGVTFMVGPPTFFVAMAAAPSFSSDRVRSLRLVSSGGAGVTPAFVEDASARYSARFKRSYGSTEAPTLTTTTSRDSAWHAANTDGRPFGATELRVAKDGELLVRGPELCAGYVDAAQNVEAFVRGGWFRTGDLASIDPDGGWLTITGRKKDVIIRAGENIAASAVEAMLEAHPWVRQAAVVGEPDDLLGERIVAFVVADSRFDLAECRRWFDAQGATRFTTPERILHRSPLPALPAGKIDKAALRTLLGA